MDDVHIHLDRDLTVMRLVSASGLESVVCRPRRGKARTPFLPCSLEIFPFVPTAEVLPRERKSA